MHIQQDLQQVLVCVYKKFDLQILYTEREYFMDEFITIKENVEFTLTEKKSKFIANLIKVNSKQDAEMRIKSIKKQYFDARHNCIAYRIIEEDDIIEKSSDDGEPSGTAGNPMLNILQKNNLCNVLIVVTRYFGGILLGTGGLVRAYSDALANAIERAEKILQVKGVEIEVTVDYNQFEKLQYYCRKNDIQIVNVNYFDNIICKLDLEDCKKDKLLEDFNNRSINLVDVKILNKKLISKSILK